MSPRNTQFNMSQEAMALGISGIYLVISGLKNKVQDSEFEIYKREVLDQLLAEYNPQGFIDNDPVLAGFRELHTSIGRSNRRFVAAPEVLVGRFIRTGQLPHINLLVDIYNLISLKTRLALGAHDISKLNGNVSLKLTSGQEKYFPLGAKLPEAVFPGEYGYIDDSNEIICRMEVLQCEKTKVDINSTDCFYIIQGNKNTSKEYLNQATEELIALTTKFCGGKTKSISFSLLSDD